MYANLWTDCTTNYLDVVFLGATEIDLDFQRKRIGPDSERCIDGALPAVTPDTAAGAKMYSYYLSIDPWPFANDP